MRFRACLEATPALAKAYRPGLSALREADRARVVCANPRQLRGSIDIDRTLAISCPNDPRWDYGIGHGTGVAEVAIWIEVHPASSAHVSEVARKAAWLRAWLAQNAADLARMTRRGDGYVWLSTGRVALQRGSRQARQLAMAGVTFPRRQWRLG